MNLFFLDPNHEQSAVWHFDKHISKMVVEACQILATCYDGTAPYKISHKNHPCCVFCRKSLDNVKFVIEYGYALAREYTFRYGRRHKSQDVLDWYSNNLPNIPSIGLTDPPRAFGKFSTIPITNCVYTDYKNYYKTKTHLFSWKNREIPEWLK